MPSIGFLREQIWVQEYPIHFAGCDFNARMTVARISWELLRSDPYFLAKITLDRAAYYHDPRLIRLHSALKILCAKGVIVRISVMRSLSFEVSFLS